MNMEEFINDIMYSIYHTHNYNKYKDISMEEYQKLSCTEKLISDIIIDYYGIDPIIHFDGKYTRVKYVIINEYNYQINTKNYLGHTLLAYWPLYKRN